jgi:hypothetical protein
MLATGNNDSGQLGCRGRAPALTPARVDALDVYRITASAAGQAHTVVILDEARQGPHALPMPLSDISVRVAALAWVQAPALSTGVRAHSLRHTASCSEPHVHALCAPVSPPVATNHAWQHKVTNLKPCPSPRSLRAACQQAASQTASKPGSCSAQQLRAPMAKKIRLAWLAAGQWA